MIKGSDEAKQFMASIRQKKGKGAKCDGSGVFEDLGREIKNNPYCFYFAAQIFKNTTSVTFYTISFFLSNWCHKLFCFIRSFYQAFFFTDWPIISYEFLLRTVKEGSPYHYYYCVALYHVGDVVICSCISFPISSLNHKYLVFLTTCNCP